MTLIADMVRFADRAHGDQKYGDSPYNVHLAVVAGTLIAHGVDDEEILAAAYGHDLLEDTPCTRRFLEHMFGFRVAGIIDAVTDQGGDLPRDKRHRLTYPGIRAYGIDAVAVKLADRLCNVRAGGKIDMYREEHQYFRDTLYMAAVESGTDLDMAVQEMQTELDERLGF
jgi:(p)ppGpp synthase/HD superfamily hydrolase